MKIIVKSEIGREKNPTKRLVFNAHSVYSAEDINKNNDCYDAFEQSVTTYPAPGIADGEHEAEFQWQLRVNRDLVEAGIEKEIRWMDANKTLAEELRLSTPEAFRQIYRLSPAKKEAEVKQDGWIKVEDRLPKIPDEWYLVSVKNKNKEDGIYLMDIAVFDSDGQWQKSNTWEKVTHWQPLPEPPNP